MISKKLYQNPVQDDEIDLMLILGNGINFIRKNLKIFILFIVLGLIEGIFAFVFLPRTYKVNMLADSRILHGEEVTAIVDSWQNLIKKGEYNVLATKFNVRPSIIENIKHIEAEPSKRIINNQERYAFLINCEVFDNSLLDTLQAGILNAMKNSDYVRLRVETQKQNLESLRGKINNEIAELDSIKLTIHQLLRSGGNSSNPFLTDPGNINLQIVSLYERNLKIAEEIKFLDEIQVIESFTRFEKPDSPKLVICLFGGLLLGLFCAFLFIIAKNIQKKLKELPA
jgi:hypothetical protein